MGAVVVAHPFDAQSLVASARWPGALRSDGQPRHEALVSLRAHLAASARFELRRRGIPDGGEETPEAASVARDAVEAALAAILANLDRYRGQSAFATWTAKYAIHEAATAARKNGIIFRSTAGRRESTQPAHATKPPTIAP
jgi:DNA-directed RNA polymerase specialized sigma24 family protein